MTSTDLPVSQELKPCPFCGAARSDDPDDDQVSLYASLGQEAWQVLCEPCGLETRPYPSKAEAIAAWNTRAPDRTGYAAGIEAAAIELDNLTAAVTALARHNIPPDIQELLLAGNPSRGIAPGALKAALSATVPAPAIEDEDVERVKLALSPLVNEDMAEEMRDAWLDDLARAALASMPRLPKEM